MLLNTIAEKHPNSFVLLHPKAMDEQNCVRDWQVLNTSREEDIPVIEKHLVAIMPDNLTEYKEAE